MDRTAHPFRVSRGQSISLFALENGKHLIGAAIQSRLAQNVPSIRFWLFVLHKAKLCPRFDEIRVGVDPHRNRCIPALVGDFAQLLQSFNEFV